MAGEQSIEDQDQLLDSESDLLKFLPSDMFVDDQPPSPPSNNNHRHHPSFTFSGIPVSCMDSFGSRGLPTSPVFPFIHHRPPPPPPPPQQRFHVPHPSYERRAGGRPNNRAVYRHPAPTQVATPFWYRAPPPRFGTGVYIPEATPVSRNIPPRKQGWGK